MILAGDAQSKVQESEKVDMSLLNLFPGVHNILTLVYSVTVS
jgi:hypothetical protein